ncbi:MAG TPA: PAS domain S-box protein [Vicinamibacteria bacterium]|nr:PAS domain S-box protein [Vicinamibacteria bacterium]
MTRSLMGKPTTNDHSDELGTILDAAPFPLLISRLSDGEVLYANDRIAELVGLTARELVGNKTPDFYQSPADRKALLAELERAGRVTDYELRLRDKEGRERWALASVARARLRGEDVLVVGLNEITERKAAERALSDSERKFRGLVENANDIIFVLTPDGIMSYVSPNWPEVLGHDVSEIMGKSFAPFVHPDDRRACYDFLALVVRTGEKQSGIEYRVRHKDGSWRWHTSNASCLKNANGDVEWVLGIARDVTDKKKAQRALEKAHEKLRAAQAQLIEAEKIAALSSLVASITHEFNSPLGAINSVQNTLATAVARLAEDLNATELGHRENRVRSTLTAIEEADSIIRCGADRIMEIVRRLRGFVRLDEAELKPANLHEGIEDALALLHAELAGRVDVVRDYGDLPSVICHPADLNQVFLNLLKNASQAIAGRGTIAISTSVEGEMARLSFRDSGKGISEHRLKSIFDPVFSTKAERVGAGLGLAISSQIVKQHGGELTVDSRLGEGSVFTVRVPLRPQVTRLRSPSFSKSTGGDL